MLILVGVGVPSDSSKEPKNEPPFYISIIEAGTEDSKIYSYKFDQQENGKIIFILVVIKYQKTLGNYWQI